MTWSLPGPNFFKSSIPGGLLVFRVFSCLFKFWPTSRIQNNQHFNNSTLTVFCQAYIPPAKRSREKCQPPASSSKSQPILCTAFNRDTVIRLCRRTTFTCVSSQQQSRLFSIWDNFWFCAPNGIDNVLAMILKCYKNNQIWLYCIKRLPNIIPYDIVI